MFTWVLVTKRYKLINFVKLLTWNFQHVPSVVSLFLPIGTYGYWSRDRTDLSLWRHWFRVRCQAARPGRASISNTRLFQTDNSVSVGNANEIQSCLVVLYVLVSLAMIKVKYRGFISCNAIMFILYGIVCYVISCGFCEILVVSIVQRGNFEWALDGGCFQWLANCVRSLKVSRLTNSLWPTRVDASIEGVPPEELGVADTSWCVHGMCPTWRTHCGRHEVTHSLKVFNSSEGRVIFCR